jgi:hypothetical protein
MMVYVTYKLVSLEFLEFHSSHPKLRCLIASGTGMSVSFYYLLMIPEKQELMITSCQWHWQWQPQGHEATRVLRGSAKRS